MAPIVTYLSSPLAEGLIPPPSNLDLEHRPAARLAPTFRFHISQYLMRVRPTVSLDTPRRCRIGAAL